MKKKKVKMIRCFYARDWRPMGRARKKCPVCGAVLSAKDDLAHQIRKR